jgi:hypothetical protein
MKKALEDWPIEIAATLPAPTVCPEVSFIIGHRGIDRLELLLATLASIAGQRNCSLECVVVEQSLSREIQHVLPQWVKYIHTPLPYREMAYSRSWAFNIGARAATGNLLILHDNDMLVPRDFASQLLGISKEGFEVINLKRFIFYLGREHSQGVTTGQLSLAGRPPEAVTQNLEAGGSIAVSRQAYFAIGGFDESFVGWGGEDNEFWERAQTLKVWSFGYLPILHLWHAPQSGKLNSERAAASLYEERSAIPVSKRIAELTARDFGNSTAPY